jgi:hypothetical protein
VTFRAEQFPHGRLGPDDEGVTTIGIAVEDDVCVIVFPEPTTWIGLTAVELRPFIAVLQRSLSLLEAAGG